MQNMISKKSQYNKGVPYDPVVWHAMVTNCDVSEVKRQLNDLSLKNAFDGKGIIEHFVPICHMQNFNSDKSEREAIEMPFNFVFIRTSRHGLTKINKTLPELNLVKPINNESGRRAHVIIDDKVMTMFRKVVSVFDGNAPCFLTGEFDIDRWDLVRIEAGPFEGIEGRLMFKPGKFSGLVMLPIGNLFIVATGEIERENFKVVAFGNQTNHQYYQFDVNIQRATKALFTKLSSGSLDFNQLNEMKTFIQRYGELKVNTRNTISTHYGLMLMCQTALGNDEEASKWLIECKKILPKLKSEIQRGQHLAMMFAATGDKQYADQLHCIVDKWGELTYAQRKRKRIVGMLNAFESVYDSLKWIKQ